MRARFLSSTVETAPRWAVSLVAAVTLHALIVAAAWPWVKPYLLASPVTPARSANPQATAGDGMAGVPMPIISGDIAPDSGAAASSDADYASQPWQTTAAIAPADARLPFSAAVAMQGGARLVTVPAWRRIGLIAPRGGGATIQR